MKPHREIEIKLKVENPQALRRSLGKLGFRRSTPTLLERNTLFDLRDGTLRRAGCVLRLRTVGGKHFLTYKARAAISRGHKIRDEIETAIGDATEMRRILERLGLRPVFRYDKQRTTYASPGRSPRTHVLVFDETPAGDYIELEGPPGWIDRVAKQLGYAPGDYVTASYVKLYLNHRRTRRPGAREQGLRGTKKI